MTKLWDVSGRLAIQLQRTWNQEQADDLKQFMTAVYEVIRDDPKYEPYKVCGPYRAIDKGLRPLLEVLKELSETAWRSERFRFQFEIPFETVFWTIQTLHSFDHANGRNYTERRYSKREFKNQAKMIKEFRHKY